MLKTKRLVLTILLGTALGAIYGATHCQLTYSISEEYFSKFLFVQFSQAFWGFGENIGTLKTPEIATDNPRLSAAFVGAFYTSWIGFIMGSLFGIIGLRSKKQHYRITLKAFLITMTTTALFSFIGLIPAMAFLGNAHPNWYMPDNIVHRETFFMAGSVDSAGYIGAFVGLVVASIFTIKQIRKYR